MAEGKVSLTEQERDALACLCPRPVCPIHSEEADNYIEHYVDHLFATVETIIAARMEQAWDEGVRQQWAARERVEFNPYRSEE